MTDYTAENLRNLVTSMVAVIPAHCGCRGDGWIVTDFDTIHQCPKHFRDQPNHEFCEEDHYKEFNWAAARLRLEREAYVYLRGEAIDWLMSQGVDAKTANSRFLAAVKGYVANPSSATPTDWLEAAEDVMADFRHGYLTPGCVL